MTEREAIEALKLEDGLEINSKTIRRLAEFFDGLDAAIKALEEIQQYRVLGTPEELKTAIGNGTKYEGEMTNKLDI